ncbi:sigma-70 family RNA polymerase sigma factor [Methylobacterium brachiatum]|uniref:sigma-70 family RNA polymerase sigma factor n=1 Tax=Methylobacterium brachiatum TaxID=269660 RepID=UPI0033145ACC
MSELDEGWEERSDADENGSPAPTTEASISTALTASAESRVERVVDDLIADWERGEGKLSRPDVERLSLKRRLLPDQIVAVFMRLRANGIELDDVDEDSEEAPAEIVESNKAEFVSSYFPRAFLDLHTQIELGRKIQIGLLASAELKADEDNTALRELVEEGLTARSKLVTANMRLVLSVAWKSVGRGLDLADLVQNGTLGLIRAAELFNPDLGLRFSTYATWWIRQAIHRGLDNDVSSVRLPVHRIEDIRKLRRTANLLRVETGQEPTIADLASALEWQPEKVAFIQRLSSFRAVPIDTPVDSQGEITLGDVIPCSDAGPEDILVKRALMDLVRELVASLPMREQEVVASRFGLETGSEQTLQQIGDRFGVTRERIRQIEAKALERLKPRARTARAGDFL